MLKVGHLFCRQVFGSDLPVFLCTWHVTRAWLKQLRAKLKSKSRFQETFNALHKLMYMKGGESQEKTQELIQEAIHSFKARFQDAPAVVTYFERKYQTNTGALLRHLYRPNLCLCIDCSMWQCRL